MHGDLMLSERKQREQERIQESPSSAHEDLRCCFKPALHVEVNALISLAYINFMGRSKGILKAVLEVNSVSRISDCICDLQNRCTLE